MGVKVMNLVWEKSSHKGSELLVLLALADWSNDEGQSIYPAVPTLAKKTRLSKRNVQYVLTRLEKSGELTVHRQAHGNQNGRATNEYRINIEALGTGAKIARVQPAARQGCKKKRLGVQPIAPNPSVSTNDPSIGASAPTQTLEELQGDSTVSTAPNMPPNYTTTATKKVEKLRDPLELQFEWSMQNSPDMRKIKSARASENAKTTCLEVLRILQTPVKNVKTWTAGGQRLYEVCGGDMSIIQAAYERLTQSKKPMTLSDPWSLVDTAVSIVGEMRRGEVNGRPSQVQFAPGHMITLPSGEEVDEREFLARGTK